MEESQKETSTTVEFKKKNSLLDEEIGNKFMKSWKSISMTDDDTMDFNFDTISKGNDKAFDFAKMDLAFNLDGDFEKISSFTVDLPDLDFSCPPKKTAKPRHSSQEESSKENRAEKKDGLNFSFEFNDLEGFNIDKSAMDGGSASNFKIGRKEMASSKSECEDSKFDIAEGFEASHDAITKKFPASNILSSSKVGISIKGEVVLDSKDANSESHMDRTSTLEANTEEQEDRKNFSSVKEIYMPTQQRPNDISAQSKGKNESDKDTCAVLRADICSLEMKEATTSGGECCINDKTLRSVEYCESDPLNNAFKEHQSGSERNGSEGNNAIGNTPIEIMNNNRSIEGELDRAEKSVLGFSMKILDSIKDVKEIKILTPKLPSIPPGGFNNEGFTSVSEINGCKLAGESLLLKKGANKEPVLVRSEQKSSKGLFSLCPNPSSSTRNVKTNSKACLSTKLLKSPVEAHQSSEDVLAQGNRLCSIKSSMKMPDLSRLKVSSSEGEKVQSTVCKKELNLKNSNKNNEVEQRNGSKILLSTLKRKLFEASTTDLVPLKPPKRLSPSLNESRNPEVSSEEKIKQKAPSKINNESQKDLTATSACHYGGYMMEIDVHQIMENDGNVEKTEAYTKDLEHICNMLKKKHDEAKEILVRALVVNNNLLMLNHPIHEEKIRKVQKFAAQLLSKDIQT